MSNFYPRSPCGERRSEQPSSGLNIYFYPRSPCGERPLRVKTAAFDDDFYPRSPCGERRDTLHTVLGGFQFLSTLSLRRATSPRFGWLQVVRYFYPRSPCGERPTALRTPHHRNTISIHALLAESDTKKKNQPGKSNISIHALLAESDVPSGRHVYKTRKFLSTLSLRRATEHLLVV